MTVLRASSPAFVTLTRASWPCTITQILHLHPVETSLVHLLKRKRHWCARLAIAFKGHGRNWCVGIKIVSHLNDVEQEVFWAGIPYHPHRYAMLTAALEQSPNLHTVHIRHSSQVPEFIGRLACNNRQIDLRRSPQDLLVPEWDLSSNKP